MFWESIYGLCQVSVHREGVNPSSMEGVLDLSDYISVSRNTGSDTEPGEGGL